MEFILEAKNLGKFFGKKETAFEALKNIDVAIKPKEKIAIIGKSGSGKSTLMHILACLDRPTSGELFVSGTAVKGLKETAIDNLRSEQFGFVFQQFFTNPNDSVLDNVALPLKIKGVPKAQRRKQALEALNSVGLADKAKNRARDLSGGQKQRVCIARAIVNNPRVIFADEPTGNLDTSTGNLVIELLFKLNKELGVTLVIVTHDPELAERCDRQIELVDGVLRTPKASRGKK